MSYHLDAHGEVGAVLEVVPPLGEGPARGVDGGVGLGGGVELPDLAPDVAVLRAQPGVPAPLRDLQPPHPFRSSPHSPPRNAAVPAAEGVGVGVARDPDPRAALALALALARAWLPLLTRSPRPQVRDGEGNGRGGQAGRSRQRERESRGGLIWKFGVGGQVFFIF
jgi:hypothetical protein